MTVFGNTDGPSRVEVNHQTALRNVESVGVAQTMEQASSGRLTAVGMHARPTAQRPRQAALEIEVRPAGASRSIEIHPGRAIVTVSQRQLEIRHEFHKADENLPVSITNHKWFENQKNRGV